MHLFNLIYLWSRLDSSATKRSQWTYWTVRLLKFGVHKLPLSKTANLGMKNKISSKNLVVLYAHAEVNWPQFSWSHRQKGNYGQTAIGSFFKTFFFFAQKHYIMSNTGTSARQKITVHFMPSNKRQDVNLN